MNRDNVLFLVIGILTGFIGGYVLHEAMATRQPPPLGYPTGVAATAAPAIRRRRRPRRRQQAGASRRWRRCSSSAPTWRRIPTTRERSAGVWPTSTTTSATGNAPPSSTSRYLELEPGDRRRDDGPGCDLPLSSPGLRRHSSPVPTAPRDLAPDHWRARYNEILVLAFDLGDFEAASSVMAELMRLQPDNPDVARLAAELEKRSKGA